ncbi:MAG: manganese efflux pump [Ruminococcus sp.]|nr:manganese efflux pump [Ruminococcus sp.]
MMYTEIFLALIVSLDTYLAAAAYSDSEIRIPPLSALIISFTGAAVLGISLKFSELLSRFIASGICSAAGLIILIVIGIITMFKSFIRCLIKRLSGEGRDSLKINGFGLGISIYLDETAADIDSSKSLSAYEAAALALASSLDSAATGINCGFTGIQPLPAAIFTFVAGFLAIILGGLTGKKISSMRHDFSWVGGAMLIIFAIFSYAFQSS